MACADWDAISELLGDTPYLFGQTPTTYDTSLFAFIECTLGFPKASAITDHLNKKQNLVAYRDQIKTKYFPPN